MVVVCVSQVGRFDAQYGEEKMVAKFQFAPK